MLSGSPPDWLDEIAGETSFPQQMWDGVVGFEFRLQGKQRVDFGFGLRPAGTNTQAFLEWMPQGHVRQRLAQWSSGRHPLSRIVPQVALEFDRGSDLHSPSLFLQRRPDILAFSERPDDLMILLADLCGTFPDPDVAAAYREALELLPAGVAINSVGLMLQRGGARAVRVVAGPFSAESCAEFLARMGSQSRSERVAELAARAPLRKARLSMSWDVGPHATDLVGLEIAPAEPWMTAGQQAEWTAVADWLVDLHLATPARADLLRAWAQPVANGQRHHSPALVKLSFDSDGSVRSVKAYVGVCATHPTGAV